MSMKQSVVLVLSGYVYIVEQIKHTIGDLPVYLTFEIDCLDPAFAPGTGTPVCGGLSTDKVLRILQGLRGISLPRFLFTF